MQFVSCYFVVRFVGPGAVVCLVHLYIWSLMPNRAAPPAGQNTELVVCRSGRKVGMLNLAG